MVDSLRHPANYVSVGVDTRIGSSALIGDNDAIDA